MGSLFLYKNIIARRMENNVLCGMPDFFLICTTVQTATDGLIQSVKNLSLAHPDATLQAC